MNYFSRGENTSSVLTVSTDISRAENYFSLQLDRVDAVGNALLRKIEQLLEARPDLSRRDFGAAIGRPTPSWVSEFFSGKRTTDSLRLVIRMAKFFGVPVGFLLGEGPRDQDARTVSLMGAWRELDSEHRDTVLQLALRLRPKRPPNEK